MAAAAVTAAVTAAGAAAGAAARAEAGAEQGQLGLYGSPAGRRRPAAPAVGRVCAGCRAREARYGFQDGEGAERPRTLCFECFRMELDRRQRAAAQLARGWNAEQEPLPLADTLRELDLRRRRAQIAARKIVA